MHGSVACPNRLYVRRTRACRSQADSHTLKWTGHVAADEMDGPSEPSSRRRIDRRSVLAGVATGVVGATGCITLPGGRGHYDLSQNGFYPEQLPYDETYPHDVDISMFRHGLRRLGYYPEATVPGAVSRQWSLPVNYIGHTAAKSSPRPAPGEDTVVVAADTGEVHGVSTMGRHGWTTQTEATHLGIHSTPTIVDGTAYVGGYDGDLYALDVATGSREWVLHNSSMGWPTAIGSSPAYWDGYLYFMAEYLDPNRGALWIANAHTGKPVWSDDLDIGGMPHPSPAISPVDERLVAGSNDGVVYAWEFPSMNFQWRFETGGEVKGTPPVYEGSTFVGSWDNHVYSLALEDGREEWTFETGGIVMSNPGIDPDSGTLYVGSGDGYVYALDVDSGEEVWSRYVGGTVLGSLTVTSDCVLVGSYDTHLYALEKGSGETRWRVQNRGHVTSEPVPHDGKIYYAERADISGYWNDDTETVLEQPGHAYCLVPEQR